MLAGGFGGVIFAEEYRLSDRRLASQPCHCFNCRPVPFMPASSRGFVMFHVKHWGGDGQAGGAGAMEEESPATGGAGKLLVWEILRIAPNIRIGAVSAMFHMKHQAAFGR